jgi:hypothetical protein
VIEEIPKESGPNEEVEEPAEEEQEVVEEEELGSVEEASVYNLFTMGVTKREILKMAQKQGVVKTRDFVSK